MGEYSISEAMQQFLDESRLKGSIQALQIEDAWELIMGRTIARHTDQIRIIGDRLIISTSVAPLKQELFYQRELIIKRVNEAFGKPVIREVMVQ